MTKALRNRDMNRFSAFLKSVGEAVQVAKIVRAPLFVSVFACVALFLPDQTREVYRILAQPLRPYGFSQLGFAFLALLVATAVPPIVGRRLVLRRSAHLLQQDKIAGILARWLPRVCGALIPIGMAVGLAVASREMSFELPAPVVEPNPDLIDLRAAASAVEVSLRWSSGLCLLLAAVQLLAGQRCDASPIARPPWPSRTFTALLAAFIVVASITVSSAPVTVAQVLGSLAILLAFIVTLILALGATTAYFDRYRVPAISCCFILAVLFSAFGWNDNHAVQLEKSDLGRLPSARAALEGWLDTRNDRDYYQNVPYPVFFVAAAGGGMYAAHHAATVMARLQDRCPNFAQHVFAISAVSGGSVGAAVFASLVKHYPANTDHKDCRFGAVAAGALEQRVRKYFVDTDLLAPVVAATLFPDFLQRFLPFKINGFDRALALEAGLADAWSRAAPDKADENPFKRPFLTQRDPKNPGPALILNATDVEHGYRVAVTPFEIVSLGIDNIPSMTKIAEFHNAIRGIAPAGQRDFNRDLTLGSAVGLSARFPWILPAATLHMAKHDARIVDGGYFENSGAETILDLLDTLRGSYHGGGKQKISVHIITISSLDFQEPSSWQGIGEILSPVRTMLSTRDARGTLSIYRIATLMENCFADRAPDNDDKTQRRDDRSCNQADAQSNIFPLNLIDFPIPLGWQLSPISARLVGLHSGYPDQVNSAPAGDITSNNRDERIFGYINQANEAACAIEKLLHGSPSTGSCALP
jgi:hypothetical protein